MLRFTLAALILAMASAAGAQAPRPNIVMIISDDHAWTDYSFMGHPQIKTPNLDKLANESVVFRRGYVTASLCCPSLASILTGKYPHQTRVTGNEPQIPAGVATRPAGQLYKNPQFQELLTQFNGLIGKHPRLPSELARAGYVSLQTGKWWGGNFSTGGFTHGMSHGDPSKGGRHGDDGLKIGRQTMQPIFDFIEQNQGKPFFVWYAPMLPHDPHTPPDRILAKYKDKTPSLHVAKYWANVEFFDATCGQLLDYLEQKKLKDNTIVVYVADNGWIQDPESGRFRADSKQSQYDGGLRTPIMIRWPGKATPRFDDTAVSAIDIAPTLYKACGVEVPPGLTGINLLDPQAVSKRGPVYGSCGVHTAIDYAAPEKNWTYRWVVAGDWKLIVPNEATVKKVNRPGRKIEVELYQIAHDPNEEKNLASENAEKVAELRKLLDAWWDGGPAR